MRSRASHFRVSLPLAALSLASAVLFVLTMGGFGVFRAEAASVTPPDLAMAQLRSFMIDTTTIPRRKLLRFTTEAVNIGSGPLEIHGKRPDVSTPVMSVSQRIHDDAGGYIEIPSPATMHWSGDDGHNHWHTTDFVRTDLIRPDNGVKLGSSAKQDFCFLDSRAYRITLPGAPQAPVYLGGAAGCRGSSAQSSLAVTMGISVGWSDVYSRNLTRQWIDITGLANGRYRLEAKADPTGWYQESGEANNSTWAEIRITNNSVKVLSRAQNP